MFKYRIKELLDELPHATYNEALSTLVSLLDVSRGTFNDWKNLDISDSRDIPAQKLFIIAKFLRMKPEELLNYEVEVKPFSPSDESITKPLKTRQKIKQA